MFKIKVKHKDFVMPHIDIGLIFYERGDRNKITLVDYDSIVTKNEGANRRFVDQYGRVYSTRYLESQFYCGAFKLEEHGKV
jgi:hypothetical protein